MEFTLVGRFGRARENDLNVYEIVYHTLMCYCFPMRRELTNQVCVCGLHLSASRERVYLSLDDLSSRWKVTPGWVYKNHKRIGLPSIKPGGQLLRFPVECLAAWESANTHIWAQPN